MASIPLPSETGDASNADHRQATEHQETPASQCSTISERWLSAPVPAAVHLMYLTMVRVERLKGDIREAVCELFYTLKAELHNTPDQRDLVSLGAIVLTRGNFELDCLVQVLNRLLGSEVNCPEEDQEQQEQDLNMSVSAVVRIQALSIQHRVRYTQATIAGKHANEILPLHILL